MFKKKKNSLENILPCRRKYIFQHVQKKLGICMVSAAMLALTFALPVYAQCTLLENDNLFFKFPNAECFGNPAAPTEENGVAMIKSLIYGFYFNLRQIISALAIAYIAYGGFRMVTARGEEEVIKTQRTHMLWTFIGLILLSMAWNIMEVFNFKCDASANQCASLLDSSSEILDRVKKFDFQARIILTFGRYIIGSIAILYLVRSGSRLITGGYNEEAVTTEKKNFAGVVIALIFIMISDFLVNEVLYKINKTAIPIAGAGVAPSFNTEKGLDLLAQITTFVASFAPPVAIMMIVIGGLLYATSQGEEDKMNKAKTILKSTVIGLIVIYAAYALVATFIAGNLEATT